MKRRATHTVTDKGPSLKCTVWHPQLCSQIAMPNLHPSSPALGSTSHREQRPPVMRSFNFPLHPRDRTVSLLFSPLLPLSLSIFWREVAAPLLAQGSSLSLSSESPPLPLKGTLASSFSPLSNKLLPLEPLNFSSPSLHCNCSLV